MTDAKKLDEGELKKKFASLAPLLERGGPFARNNEGFEPSAKLWKRLTNTRVLVVGAGGLGCEILKDLALSGFSDIHVIDLDTIDMSNLNRQFLFRMKDVGQPKAKVAAEFIEKRCPSVKVKWHVGKIQDYKPSWYSQFNFVIAGLDNVEARAWLNATLVDLVKFDEEGDIDWDSVVFLIDGGTEGFGGQSRVFVPHFTSCFECSMASMPPPRGFPQCTIKSKPRLPDHCIAYALQMQWPLLESFNSPTDYKMYTPKAADDSYQPNAVQLDKDDPAHMTWLMNRAQERADQFGIKGVTFNMTMQVVKNIIPAIASTNALISAACVNEVVKMRTLCALMCNNFYMYVGRAANGINSQTFPYARNPKCPVCHKRLNVKLSRNAPLSDLAKAVEAGAKFTEVTQIAEGEKQFYNRALTDADALKQPLFAHGLKPGVILLATDKTGAIQKVVVEFED